MEQVELPFSDSNYLLYLKKQTQIKSWPTVCSRAGESSSALIKYIVESCAIDWQPLPIREIIQKAQMEGHHPCRLHLGHCEAGSLRRHLNENFDENVPNSLTSTYYLGLKVQEEDQEHLIEIDGEKSVIESKDDLPPIENNKSPRWHDHDPIPDEEKTQPELSLTTKWDTAEIRSLIEKNRPLATLPLFSSLAVTKPCYYGFTSITLSAPKAYAA